MTLTQIPIDFAKDYNYKSGLTPSHLSYLAKHLNI
jgi:hypothetical protein